MQGGVREDPRQSLPLMKRGRDSGIRTKPVESDAAANVGKGQVYFSEEVPEPLLDMLSDFAIHYPNGLVLSHGSMNYGMELLEPVHSAKSCVGTSQVTASYRPKQLNNYDR